VAAHRPCPTPKEQGTPRSTAGAGVELPEASPARAGHDEPNGSGGGSLVVRFGVAWTETARYTDVTFRRNATNYRPLPNLPWLQAFRVGSATRCISMLPRKRERISDDAKFILGIG
jgi:hypothetical protein